MTKLLLIKLEALTPSHFEQSAKNDFFEPMDLVLSDLPNHYESHTVEQLVKLGFLQSYLIKFQKEGNAESSEETIRYIKEILGNLTGEARILGRCFAYPALSFSAFKGGRTALAKRYITLTVKADDHLSDRFTVLHLHKLHHVLNLLQIELGSCKIRKAAGIIRSILKYLFFGKLEGPFGRGDESYLISLYTIFSESKVLFSIYTQIFTSLWLSLDLEKAVIADDYFVGSIGSFNNENFYLKAVKDYLNIQKGISRQETDRAEIYDFFKNYQHFHFDILKLLIIRHIYIKEGKYEYKSRLLLLIQNKLSFKFPNVIIESIRSNDYEDLNN